MGRITRRAALLGTGAVIGAVAAHAWSPALPDATALTRLPEATPEGMLNDASLLQATPIHRHRVTDATGDAFVDLIRAEMNEARAAGRPVCVSAARHSMGGQSIPRYGHAITADNGALELDRDAGTYRVHSGARWAQVIAALDAEGFSPKIMQSNHDFGVAACFCVNAHGWPAPFGPMGSSVRSLRLVLPSGDLVTASRDENADLFAMSMGGYGLTGAIVDLEVEAVPNARLVPRFDEMPAGDFATAFRAALDGGDVPMAYGRLNVARDGFFDRALLITYRATEDQADLPPAAGSGAVSKLARHLYRAQLGRERMKALRWWLEADVGPRVAGGETTRNSLVNEPVVTLDDRDPTRTDILHEYFVPFESWDAYLDLCRNVIPGSFQEFLNVTLRFVDTDAESWLSYAATPRIATVMSFSQEMSARAEADMARMTRELIDGILAIGGSYYLPYRPHATPDQFARAYPRAADFAAAKRAMDPDLIFRNNLWDRYVGTL
ncbi:FAD-binding oxidoreductase [Jannaschia sp. S6380]|uniref:FAD-binding oxidoreductase n=1 Tax=Jannaschia sp. S6380 TaxID=2926408 RepID=UPI001FF143AE|nr:FAD-binding oxidoreductase [Jannaschia sp. S6380]MCK0168952.1 FAD-binding oxidoreductase [Jannaschia sp. S6380]